MIEEEIDILTVIPDESYVVIKIEQDDVILVESTQKVSPTKKSPNNTDEDTTTDALEHKCSICSKHFKFNSILKRHLLIHQEKKKYCCTLCNKIFADPTTLRYHKLSHTDKRSHQCNQCEASFKRKYHLDVHMISHASQDTVRIPCSFCDKTYSRKCHLNFHVKQSHSAGVEKIKHLCQICAKEFSSKSCLTRHNKNDICNVIDTQK